MTVPCSGNSKLLLGSPLFSREKWTVGTVPKLVRNPIGNSIFLAVDTRERVFTLTSTRVPTYISSYPSLVFKTKSLVDPNVVPTSLRVLQDFSLKLC